MTNLEDFKSWLAKNELANEKGELADNGFNLYRFRHGFTIYHTAKLLGLGQTAANRYAKTTAKDMKQSASVLFLVLNKLDDMHESGSLKISSVDLF